MMGDKIPEQDHIARYCQSSKVEDGQVQPSAFMLRPTDNCLSVNWLEVLDCSSRESEINEIRGIYAHKFNRLGARSLIAILNVGEILQKVYEESEDKRKLEILHDPEDDDPSHSGIYKLKHNDMLIAELILETVRETYPAR